MAPALARKRFTALLALAAFVFAQAAVATMGCITLRPDASHGNIAVMPSGEPCDMMGQTPAPLILQHVSPDSAGASGDAAPSLLSPTLPFLVAKVSFTEGEGSPAFLRLRHSERILGPPSLRLTGRLRI